MTLNDCYIIPYTILYTINNYNMGTTAAPANALSITVNRHI